MIHVILGGTYVITLLLAVYNRQVPTFINTNLVLEEVATSNANRPDIDDAYRK